MLTQPQRGARSPYDNTFVHSGVPTEMRHTSAARAMRPGPAGRTCLPIALLIDYDISAMCRQHASRRRAAVEEHRCSTEEGEETDACDD